MVKNLEKYEVFSSIIRRPCFCGLIVDFIPFATLIWSNSYI